MRVVFVRHGQTVWNSEDRMQGQLDAELSELGMRQAECAARALVDERIDAIYASDLQRAYITAEVIARTHGLPVTRTPLLREVYLGKWQGLTIGEIEERFPVEYKAYRKDSIANRPPQAERLESVIARAGEFLSGVTSDHPTGNIVVVTHGGIIRGALCCALTAGPELFRRVKLDNAGITTTIFPISGQPHVLAVNEVCHLKTLSASVNVQEL